MRLTDIAMIAGETNRSQAYLQALVQKGYLPGFVLLMVNRSKNHLPGQQDGTIPDASGSQSKALQNGLFDVQFNSGESLQETLTRSGIGFAEIESTDINSDAVFEAITGRPESVFIYSGYGGGILRKRILRCGRRFLHVHGGYLPDYKGSTTNYYSLLQEGFCGASSLWLEQKIDSGPILLRRKVAAPADRNKIDYDFDSLLRAQVLIDTIDNYLTHNHGWDFGVGTSAGGETYFIMHPLLRHIAVMGKVT
jgi:methionyl-tRNA formyltransferase